MSGIKNYSSNANLNTNAPPNGAPEGMLPSFVDDTMRQMMADTRSFYESTDYKDLGYTPTYSSATKFLLSGDRTSYYTANRPIKCVDASTLYGYVVSATYSVPNTAVTISLDSGSLSTAIASVAVSLLDPTYAAISAASSKFVPSGTGAAPTDLLKRGRLVALSSDFDTSSHFNTARDALTATFAAANYSFPSTPVASTDPNTLDDYEEGTFTPSIGGSATYTWQNGVYTKIGRLVHFALDIAVNAIGTGSAGVISGLPFSVGSAPHDSHTAYMTYWNGAASAYVTLNPFLGGSGTSIQFNGLTAGGATLSGTSPLTSGTRLLIGGNYYHE